MFYRLIKFLAGIGIPLYCRNRWMHCESLKNLKGPAIIASNHPNSMLDAAITGLYCGQPIYYTIRSDVFNIAAFRTLLKWMNGIPFYRQKDGKGQSRNNFSTIEKCTEILRNGGIILIFSEGISENEWKLKPVKSGIASMVWDCRNDEHLMRSLKVLPLGITYDNFEKGHKTIYINSGEPILPFHNKEWETEGEWKKEFKEVLYDKMLPLAPQLHSADIKGWKFILTNYYQTPNWNSSNTIEKLNKLATIPAKENLPSGHLPLKQERLLRNWILSLLLFPPAIAGYALNGLFYIPFRSFAKAKTKGTIFFDSVFFGSVILLYPIYWLIVGIILSIAIPYGWICFIAAPLSAWFAIEWNYNISSLLNYIRASGKQKELLKNFFSV